MDDLAGYYLAGNGVPVAGGYSFRMISRTDTVGAMVRDWRSRRRLSQLDLAGEVDVSARHLSFVENGRSRASRDLLLKLADLLKMPFRERNRLLLTGGYAPVYPESTMDAPDMAAAKRAVQGVLEANDPFPALAVDRHWNLIFANAGAGALMRGVAPELLVEPVNVLRLSLHPGGLAPRIANLAQWKHHLLDRLRTDMEVSPDPVLIALHDELRSLPAPSVPRRPDGLGMVAVPLLIRDLASDALLSFISTTTVFGTALNVTLAEMTLECFYPADDFTRAAFGLPST